VADANMTFTYQTFGNFLFYAYRTKIQWAKDHNFISHSKKYKISKKGALRIQDVTHRDGGIYTCLGK
jgi:hypothetical protein